jgi:hypothetical protein
MMQQQQELCLAAEFVSRCFVIQACKLPALLHASRLMLAPDPRLLRPWLLFEQAGWLLGQAGCRDGG